MRDALFNSLLASTTDSIEAKPKAAGVSGNTALTAQSGILLLILLAAEGVTVVQVRGLFTPHVFIGLLLLPVIGVKLTSVGYRFVRYYTGNSGYRAAGPPHPIPRLLAPFLILSTLLLFASGVVLLAVGPVGGEVWRRVHIVAFFGWFWLMTAHVLAYSLRALHLSMEDMTAVRPGPDGQMQAARLGRSSLVVGSLLLGIVLAIGLLPADSSWLQWIAQGGGGH